MSCRSPSSSDPTCRLVQSTSASSALPRPSTPNSSRTGWNAKHPAWPTDLASPKIRTTSRSTWPSAPQRRTRTLSPEPFSTTTAPDTRGAGLVWRRLGAAIGACTRTSAFTTPQSATPPQSSAERRSDSFIWCIRYVAKISALLIKSLKMNAKMRWFSGKNWLGFFAFPRPLFTVLPKFWL